VDGCAYLIDDLDAIFCRQRPKFLDYRQYPAEYVLTE
jgi:hypothetical protein